MKNKKGNKYIEKAIKLLDRPLWKDKPYSNAVHVVADLLERTDAKSNKEKG